MPNAFSGHQFVIRKGIVRTDQMNLQELVKLLVPVQILTIFDAKMENVSITAMFVMVKMSGKCTTKNKFLKFAVCEFCIHNFFSFTVGITRMRSIVKWLHVLLVFARKIVKSKYIRPKAIRRLLL